MYKYLSGIVWSHLKNKMARFYNQQQMGRSSSVWNWSALWRDAVIVMVKGCYETLMEMANCSRSLGS